MPKLNQLHGCEEPVDFKQMVDESWKDYAEDVSEIERKATSISNFIKSGPLPECREILDHDGKST